MNPTTVWSALSVAQAVAGGIAWIDPSTFQPNVDALNLYWDATNLRMSVKTAGDYSGTDAVNSGGQFDSYVPNGFAIGTVGSPPAYGVSTSRGTRFLPTISLTGDPIGSFGAYAYLGDGVIVGKAFFEMASIRAYVSGAHATYPAGELRVGSKLDNGAYVESYKLIDKDGHISPIVTGTTKLGLASKGWGAFYLDYTDAGATGAIAINKPSGSVLFAAAAQTLVLTNNLITANSRVIATVATDDATAFACKAIPAAGTCTLKLNAAATAQTKVNWVVVGAD
jgi:hypothetical protein